MDATKKVPNSPEFEFWMLRNPSFPQPQILSADQLFANGLLLPLNTPHPNTQPPPPPPPEPTLAAATPSSSSKRWKDIFRKSQKDKEKAPKKEKKNAATTSPELNIRIWPFSRSRSAGNAPAPPRLFPGAPFTRKVNSAPCSRSNSTGESKSRRRPSSPGRAGLHLGRSSPVWQVRRPKNPETTLLLNPESHLKGWTSRRSKAGSGAGSASAKARVLNVNVPTCIAYGHHLSCRNDANSAIDVSGGFRSKPSHTSVAKGKFFNLRTLFTKKTVVTSH